jgi:hypothetical protein
VRFRRELFWLGWIVYISSFFLAAVGPSNQSRPTLGYFCAYATLLFSWQQANHWLHGMPSIDKPLEYVSVLVSGWINPVFLIAVIVTSFKRLKSLARLAAIIVVFMIPSCWFVFYYYQLYPREGHILWIAGMLMVLCSRIEFGAN